MTLSFLPSAPGKNKKYQSMEYQKQTKNGICCIFLSSKDASISIKLSLSLVENADLGSKDLGSRGGHVYVENV